MKLKNKNIVLIGMPGCGKTTIGRSISHKLNKKFIDVDEYIECKYNKSIPQIFKEKGEEYFRNIELKAVKEISNKEDIIISTGGGVIKNKQNIINLKQNGVVIFIDRKIEDIVSDVDISSRPLLKNGTAEIEKIFSNRYDLYRKYADFLVENNCNIEELINKIILIYYKFINIKQYTPVKVKNVVIGDGYPKICVPIAGRTTDDIIDEANFLKEIGPDVVEWRVDFFKYVKNIDKVKEVLKMIREILYDKPIIFTFRSYSEGGEIEVTREFYIKLNTSVIDTKFVDIVDIELFNDVEDIKQLIKRSHENSVSIIISNHDFNKTPNKYEIISRLCRAQQLGADISKIAVMPNSTKDVITLLDATRIMKEKYAKRPIITMSMAGKGVISRLSGELFGSDMTFGSAKNISAPGQIPIRELRKIINLLHNNL